MDNWHSEWVVEGPDFDTSQNSPKYLTAQWSEGEEDNTADSQNFVRDSSESGVDEKESYEKGGSPIKAGFKNVSLAKKRLQAYSKQNNKKPSKEEKVDAEDRHEKSFAKKSKKDLYPDEKAKIVIQEIEDIKKKENEELLLKKQMVADAIRSLTSVTLRPRSRSLSSERLKQFKKREIKSRNYRRTDSNCRKSVSPEIRKRRGRRRSSPTHKNSVYPKNWTEYKEQKLTIVRDESLKKKCFPPQSNSIIELYDKLYNFVIPSPFLESVQYESELVEKMIPTSVLRVTKAKPPIIFNVNFEKIKESYLTRQQLFQMIPKERMEIITKLIDTPSKVQPSTKSRSQLWYNKQWKKAGEPECKVLENSVGLSFLQTYSDEEEENETEEIVICSSVKKNKKDKSETAIPTEINNKTKEPTESPKNTASHEQNYINIKQHEPDSAIALLTENKQTTDVDDYNEDRLTPIKKDLDHSTVEKTEHIIEGDDFAFNDRNIDFEERLTPVDFNLKLQIDRKKQNSETISFNENITNIEPEIDDSDRLTPKQGFVSADRDEDRLTPEDISYHKERELDEIHITKITIDELEKELKKRENKEENVVKSKKKKKTGMKRKRESLEIEDESPKSKKRKKKSKQKKKVSEDEEDSESSEEDKRKKKHRKDRKRKKEKTKKKKSKSKKDKPREVKTKKKREPSEERSTKDRKTKKKKEARVDSVVSDEQPKKKAKKKGKKRTKDSSISEDASFSKESKKDIADQDHISTITEKKKYNEWEDEELLSNALQMLERERLERINLSKSNIHELTEELHSSFKDRKSGKAEKEGKTGKEKERRRHSKGNYIDLMLGLETEELREADMNISRERSVSDHLDESGRAKERKSARGRKFSEESDDLDNEFYRKSGKSKEKRRKQKSKRIEEVRPPLYIKPDPDYVDEKQSTHVEDIFIGEKLEDFPLVKEGVAKDTPDTDEYRGNWEKDSFPVWESEDEGVPKPKEKLNTSWESDEEVYERARVIDKPLDFSEGLDLEIPLNIKPFKRREVMDADKELQLLKIESQTLNQERIQLELDKIKVKQLELSVIKEAEREMGDQPPRRRRSKEETSERVEDKAKRRRWDKREAEPSRKRVGDVVVIDLSESTSSVNTTAVLENEYEEFMKAVASKPVEEDEVVNLNDSIISLSSVSDLGDSNCSSDNALAKKSVEVRSPIARTPTKDLSQGTVPPKDIPFPMASTPVKDEQQVIVPPKDIPFPAANMPVKIVPQVIIPPKDLPFPDASTPVKDVPQVIIPPKNILFPAASTLEKDVPQVIILPKDIPFPATSTPVRNVPQVNILPKDIPFIPVASTPVKDVSQVIIAPKDIPFIPMPGEVKPVYIEPISEVKSIPVEVKPLPVGPVPAPPIDVSAIATPLPNSILPQTLAAIIEPPPYIIPEKLNLDNQEYPPKPLGPILPESSAKKQEEALMSSSLAETKPDAPEKELIGNTNAALVQKPAEKPFSFASLVLPSKKLLLDKSRLILGDSDDESDKPMKAIDEIRMENLIQSGELEKAEEEVKEEAKQETKPEVKQEAKHEVVQEAKKPELKHESKQEVKHESKQEVKHESKQEVKQEAVKETKQDVRKSETEPKPSKGGTRDRRRSRSRSPKSGGQHAREKVERKGASPRKGQETSQSSRNKRRESSPRRRGRSPRRHSSPVRSPARRKSSPGSRRRYSSRRSNSPGHRRRSPSPRRKSPKRTSSPKTSSSKSSRRARSKSPQKPESTVKSHHARDKPEASTQRPPAAVVELKKSVADSTISDDSLLPQPNLDDVSESPSSHFYSRSKADAPKQQSLNEGVTQILGYAKEDLRPISTTYDNYRYEQSQLTQILQTISQFSTRSGAGTPSKSDAFQNNSASADAYQNALRSQNSFVQVGNMVQIVPSDLNVKTEPLQTVFTDKQFRQESHMPPQERKTQIVQVGNMLQIVPNDSPPEPVLPPLPPEPKEEPFEEVAKVVTEQEKRSAEKAMQQKAAEQRAERERRRLQREARRKEKERRRREKEKQRQVKMKQKTENMIKRALQLEVEGEEDPLLNETPTQWPPLPSISSSSKDSNKSILVLGHRKSAKLDRRKVVQFADGVRPGEGTSPSAGEELSSSPRHRKLPKEKRYTKTKLKMKNKKKKIKVKIIKPPAETEESDEDDILPPPSPPPGSPPPHIFPPRVKTHAPTVNNVHPYVANLIPAPHAQAGMIPAAHGLMPSAHAHGNIMPAAQTQGNIMPSAHAQVNMMPSAHAQAGHSPALYRPPLNVLMQPLPPPPPPTSHHHHHHHHMQPPLPLSMPPHHPNRPPEPPMMHHVHQQMTQLHVPPPPPPQAVQTSGSNHRGLSYHY